jgi:hypothetical protein
MQHVRTPATVQHTLALSCPNTWPNRDVTAHRLWRFTTSRTSLWPSHDPQARVPTLAHWHCLSTFAWLAHKTTKSTLPRIITDEPPARTTARDVLEEPQWQRTTAATNTQDSSLWPLQPHGQCKNTMPERTPSHTCHGHTLDGQTNLAQPRHKPLLKMPPRRRNSSPRGKHKLTHSCHRESNSNSY